jgi:hypothetical protein
MLVDLWYVNLFLLEVWLAFYFPTRVKLRRTSAVAVSSPDLGFLASDIALLSHIAEI